MQPPADGRTRRLLGSSAALAVGIAVMVAVARLPSLVHQLFDPDEATLAEQAIALRHSGTLYVDVIDRKPPIPAYVYSWSFAAFDDTDLRPLHVVAALCLAGAAWCVAYDQRRRHGMVAAWWAAGLLVGGAVGFLPDNAQAANYAHFALLPGTAAVVAARRGTTRAALLAGVMLGLAVLCRQTWALGLVPALVAVRVHGRRRDLAVLAAGCAATVAATGLVLPFGAFWHWTFAGNGGFVASWPDWSVAGPSLLGNVAAFVVFHVALLALVAYAVLRAGQPRTTERTGRIDDLDLWLWALAGVAATVAGFRFFGHYWLQVLPPLVLLAAPAAARLRASWTRVAIAGLVVPSLVAVGFAYTPSTFRDLGDARPLAAYVDAHTRPDERVLVWGTFPEVLWLADRVPAGAFVHSDFVTGLSGNREPGTQTVADAPPDARSTMLDSLRAHPPRLVLDTSTAGLRQYGSYPLSTVPELAAFVGRHYTVVARVDGVTVYRLRPGP